MSDGMTDRAPGTITEFPPDDQLEAAATRPEEEDDYHAEIFEAPERELEAAGVKWAANDRASPCYSHLLVDGGDTLKVDKAFEVGKPEFELLIAANRFRPVGSHDIIAFGLRGARLRGDEKFENVDRLPLEDVRPDHKNFCCVIGYYFKASGKFSAYKGSTVPWHEYMSSGVKNNMLPTGCYVYKKGTHAPATESRWVTPALRLSDAEGSHSGPATVLRTKKDLVFDSTDEWDNCAPSDNVHCAYSDAKFSSLGCQTVKGGMHDGLWARFQATLKPLPNNARVDYVLVTGAEGSIAAALVKAGKQAGDPDVLRCLGRLRAGSEGDEVKALQAKLGVTVTGYLGSATKKKLTQIQSANRVAADGIYSPATDAALGWGVFSGAPAAQPAAPAPAASAPTPAPVEPPPMATAPIPRPDPVPRPEPVAQPAPAPAVTPAPPSAPTTAAVMLTTESLKTFAPKAKPDYVAILGEKGNDVLSRFDINDNTKRFCHFMAQVGHECGGFTITAENLNYSAKRMVEIFGPGKHSARITASEAQKLVGNQEAFAERVYGLGNPTKAKDLGNTQPGDGYRYRGRGFLQITGRAAYREMGRKIGIDLEAEPDRAGQPLEALMTAAAFWDSRKLNTYADQNNIDMITKRINGGHNGLADRKARFATAQRIWGSAGDGDLESVGGRRTLEYGALGPDVLELKKLLTAAGYGGFEMDEDFGRATHMAVVRFKLDRGLPADGIVDDATWDALEREAKAGGRGAPGPARPGTDEALGRVRRRGWAVFKWGLFLFLAAAAMVALRYVEDRGLFPPQSTREWAVVGFIGVIAVASIALMMLGGGIVRASRAKSSTADVSQWDELGIRPEVNLGGA